MMVVSIGEMIAHRATITDMEIVKSMFGMIVFLSFVLGYCNSLYINYKESERGNQGIAAAGVAINQIQISVKGR